MHSRAVWHHSIVLCLFRDCLSWIPCKLVILSLFFSWKPHFLLSAGSGSYWIWLVWEIKCDGLTNLHGIGPIYLSVDMLSIPCKWFNQGSNQGSSQGSNQLVHFPVARGLSTWLSMNQNNDEGCRGCWQSSSEYLLFFLIVHLFPDILDSKLIFSYKTQYFDKLIII